MAFLRMMEHRLKYRCSSSEVWRGQSVRIKKPLEKARERLVVPLLKAMMVCKCKLHEYRLRLQTRVSAAE